MQSKSFKKIVTHDLYTGISSNIPKYILSAFIFSFTAIMFFNSAFFSNMKGSILDCAIYIYRGMNVYIPSEDSKFSIPIVWLMLQLLIAFLILDYPTQDLHSYGLQILIRTKNRKLWWISKCIWNVVSIILFYLLGFVIILIFSLFFGEFSFTLNKNTNSLINEFNVNNIDYLDIAISVFILPLIISIAASLFQMVLNFILKPIYSYIIVVSVFLASAYYCSPFLIGNYSMLLRNKFVYAQGVDAGIGVVISAFIIVISVLIGAYYFKNYDILKKK